MGYRSDVYVKCEEFAFLEINKALKENGIKFGLKVDSQNDYYIEIPDIKWQEYVFDYIDNVMKVIRDLTKKEEEDGWMFVFIRLGEDDSDVEQISNDCGQLDFWVQRTVPIPEDARVISND